MAAILQFRQGSKTSFISSGPYISEPFFDTDTNIIHIGVSGSSTITLTKLEDINSGSFSVSGDISGSNLYLTGDITASNTLLSGDITIGGNIILGDQVQDNITVSGQFDSDLIPSASATYNLGSPTKKWNHLYTLSASIDSIDLVDNLPSGVISGSQQVIDSLPSGIVSSSNQIDTGSTHFQQGVELYSINGVNPLSGLYGSAGGLGVQIRGLSADGLSFDGPGNLIIDTGSDYFVSGAQEASLLGLPEGTVSSSQQVVDFLPTNTVSGSVQVLGGTNIVSSSVQVISFLPSGTVSGSSQVVDVLTQVNSFTSSQESKNTTLATYTGSVDTSISSLNSFTSSQESKNTTLATYTGSVDTSISSLNSFTNSFDTALSLNSSDVTILGNLTVQGTQTQLNTATLNVEDLNILLASGSTTSAEADGAGITIDGANKSLIWNHGNSNFLFDAQVSSSVGFSGDGSNLTGITADSVEYDNILNKPTLVSGSSQITYSDIDSIPQNIVSSSAQVTNFLPSGTVSGSTQIITLLPQGTVSGSVQVLGGANIVSSSTQVTNFLPQGTISSSIQIIEVLEVQTPGLISGSDQVTQSLDLRYLEIDGDNVLSSSNENFNDFSESVDLRLLDTLDSGSATSQSLHVLVGNFPTSGSLGTSAFYNVSSSLYDDPDSVPTVKAVFDYINNTIGAADITGVSASLGLSGGGDAGYVSLSLDTASAHFQEGVELYSSVLPSGVISSSAQITDLGFLVTSSALYNDTNNLAIGTSTPTNLGATQFTINDSNTAGNSGLISFTDSDVVKSYDYVTNNYRYVDTNTGVGIVLKPDADPAKSWVIDTDGDLVSNGGSWASGNIYANNLIASSSVTASYILVDEDITANNFIGSIQADNGVVSSSQQITDFGFISESNSLYIDANDFSFGGTPQNVFGLNQVTLRDDNTGYSGLLAFQDNTTVQSFDYVNSNYRYVDTNTGVGIVLKPDADSTKAWVVDTDGDLVSNGGSWASGNAYMNNLIASSSVTASYILVDEDITANNFIGNIQATNGVISGSAQLTGSLVDVSSNQTINGTKTFNDIVVNGTGSFAYIESVAGSAKIIGDAFIVLNNDTPTERYAGIAVYDSGSANTTASFQFDGSTNDWFYEYDDGAIDYGVVMFGPEYSTKGAPTYLTNNRIPKGDGGHHLNDSNISDDGTTITLNSDTTVNGVLSATTFDSLVSQSLLNDLTNDEVNQLKNIDSVTISNTQWGYLGAMNQGIATTDDVTFNTLSATGDIVAYASSDRRLKDEIIPISNPLEKINQIGGYSFIWNTEKQDIYKGKDYGVIAQEIEEILPELVDTRENGYKAVKYDKLVSLLIEGIKELSEEVKELKEKINNRE
jgi:hypothetical protein